MRLTRLVLLGVGLCAALARLLSAGLLLSWAGSGQCRWQSWHIPKTLATSGVHCIVEDRSGALREWKRSGGRGVPGFNRNIRKTQTRAIAVVR